MFGREHRNKTLIIRSAHLEPRRASYRGKYDWTKQELRDLLREAVENTAKQQDELKQES